MSKLPEFVITEISDDHCAGRIEPDPLLSLSDRGAMCLVDGQRIVWGRFLNLDLEQRTADFRPENRSDLESLRARRAYPYLDDYMGQRVEVVLDSTRTWRPTRFTPRDAVQYDSGLMTIAGPDAPPGGVIVADGWNHTHCFICWATISQESQPVAHVSSEHEWVCESCYENYVVPKSIQFAYRSA